MTEQPTLPGVDMPEIELKDTRSTQARPKRIDAMHNDHGVTEGRKCKECLSLYRSHWGYYKCKNYQFQGSSPASDWRLKWTACGLFEAKND